MKQNKVKISVSLSADSQNKLKELACYNDVNNSFMIEYLIKRACKGKKLTIG